ncbi:unnamed protein product [Chironomus riparius]|uniref:Uncharacterized protein n=1 Tax=Chironomus riparius TaxID=315576 RepID=A0A9N9SBB7_9DIPT|nr:unnamed protein product [Chironomus riparius]
MNFSEAKRRTGGKRGPNKKPTVDKKGTSAFSNDSDDSKNEISKDKTTVIDDKPAITLSHRPLPKDVELFRVEPK